MTGDELKQWRVANNWNQTQAARYLGVTQEAVSRWEQEKRQMPETIAHLIHLLRVKRNVRFLENILLNPSKTP